MNFKRLETFIWVASLGSFRKAAERLYTTQPGVSSRIQALEEELGCKLFDRDQGQAGIRLTAKGKELLPYAEKIIYMSEQLRKKADAELIYSGLLRLGVSETIVHSWLPRYLKLLHQEMPNLDIEITVDVTSNLKVGLLDRGIDLAFLLGPISEPSITNLELCAFPLVWAASPALGFPERELALGELTRWPIITYARNTKPFTQISQKFRELDDLPARFFSSSSLAAARQMTLDGVGVSTLPHVVIGPELESGALKALQVDWIPAELAFTASYSPVPFNAVAELAAGLAVTTAQAYRTDI